MRINLMKKIGLIIGVTFLLTAGIITVFLVHKSDAGYSTPSSREEAVQRVDWLCSQGRSIAHAGWVSNVSSVNVADGSASYDMNIIWRRCNDSVNTRAYAVTGYPSGETAVCPDVGSYGTDHTHDCVKYVGNPPYSDGGGLSCPSGRNDACTNGNFSLIRVNSVQPSTELSSEQLRVLSRSATIPDWTNKYNSSETSYTFRVPDAICAYFKNGPNDGGEGGKDCQDIVFTVRWQGRYVLTPSVTNLPPIVDGDVATAVGLIANSGVDSPGNTRWSMNLLSAAPSNVPASWSQTSSQSSDADACAYFGGVGVSCAPLSGNNESIKSSGFRRSQDAGGVDRFAIGTRLCMTMSVQARARDDGRWQHALQCATVAKKPKVQITGSDIKVGKDLAGNGGSVVTSTTYSGGKRYGSWGEYGVLAAGQVKGIASGAGFAGGTLTPLDSCALYLLTFANASNSDNCKTPGNQGGFGVRSSGSSLANYFTGGRAITTQTFDVSAADAGIYTTDHDLVLVASNPISKGKWVVIKAKNVFVTIKKDITYSNQSIASIADIPQVLIFAHSIGIDSAVQQVDSWLIADEYVSTCNAVKSVFELTARLCDQQLRINGPIVASRLLLNRTAGAGTQTRSGDPAEVINLRADSYLWLQQHFRGRSKIRTVHQKELPPRF